MRSIQIHVAGQTLQLRSDEEQSYLDGLAAEITERFQALRKGSRGVPDLQAMSMVAVALLDELRTSQAETATMRERATRFARRMLGRIDELLADPLG